MAFKNFSFRENWVGSEVAVMKIAFFTIFDPTWAYIWPQTCQKMELLKQNFNFQSLRKAEVIFITKYIT